MLEYFSKTIEVQLFYALAITLIVYAIPAGEQNMIVPFVDTPANVDMNTTAGEFQSSFSSAAGFGIVDIAALALFSGNIVIDLILNFFTAIPSMVTLILQAMFFFLSIDGALQNTVKTFVYVVISIVYVISLMNFLLEIRTGSRGLG